MAFVLHLPIVIPYLKESQTVFLESKNLIFFLQQLEVFDFVYCFRLNTFTNKISDLLLPLGTERAGGRESYPPNDIGNKYIYDAFFNDLFIYFVIVVFPFFGTSEVLIRDSQKLQFCNFVRLQEKAQDDISKRAAVEKEPLTLEKDKEEQSKYYLSCPKPLVLDMKWENHDINVVEQANIPKFPPQLNGDQEKTFFCGR